MRIKIKNLRTNFKNIPKNYQIQNQNSCEYWPEAVQIGFLFFQNVFHFELLYFLCSKQLFPSHNVNSKIAIINWNDSPRNGCLMPADNHYMEPKIKVEKRIAFRVLFFFCVWFVLFWILCCFVKCAASMAKKRKKVWAINKAFRIVIKNETRYYNEAYFIYFVLL